MGMKWGDSKPAEKILALYTTLLVSPKALSLTEIAGKLDCSKQTVCRLIDQMESSQFGRLLRENQGRQAYYRLEKPKRQPGVAINAQGLEQLALCREFMLRLLPPSMHRHMETSLGQAVAYLEEDAEAPVPDIGGGISKGTIDYTPFEAILNNLITGISKKRVCLVNYRSKRNKTPKSYCIAPVKLLAYHECIYVIAYRVTDKGVVKIVYEAPMHLALQRFISCELTRRTAKDLPGPPSTPQLLGIMEGEPFDVTAKFSAHAATYAAEREWSAGQKLEELPNGEIIMQLKARNKAECIAWILGFGPEAEILQPDWLRQSVYETIKNMALLYKEYDMAGKNS